MNLAQSYYTTNLDTNKKATKDYSKQLSILSLTRISVFLATIFGLYWFWSTTAVAIGIATIGIVAFVVLLNRYTKIKSLQLLHKALVQINEDEISIAQGHFYDRKEGNEFQDPLHAYALDIDLFGRGSLFQYLNRTTTAEGTEHLAKALKANNIADIEARQKAIQSLASKPDWRQLYSATASLINLETKNSTLLDWISDHKLFIPKIMQIISIVFSILSLVVIILSALETIPASYLAYWLFIGLGITGIYVKRINALAFHTNKVRSNFKQYASLLELIETETFDSLLLQEKQLQIKTEALSASEIFKTFSKHLDALDNRNNLISALFGNGLFMTDIRYSYNVESWLKTYGHKVKDWLEVITFFDAYNSLGTYSFNHTDYVFPNITDSGFALKTENLGHPLLRTEKRVDNNFDIKNQEFFIITGANMAGKSTFLRTVSLHIVMANTGLPVCATSSVYSPVKLITSMRTTDSLTDDSSYFFAELTRLKYIVDAIQSDTYFIILDEILKGTNSTDKAMGSKKFVEKLVASKATGLIATHDLSLCEISESLKEVKNYYFDADIINDELYFDYTFKTGICQNMNASFLLKKMQII